MLIYIDKILKDLIFIVFVLNMLKDHSLAASTVSGAGNIYKT